MSHQYSVLVMFKHVVGLCALLCLAACGGGGGGQSAPPEPPPTEAPSAPAELRLTAAGDSSLSLQWQASQGAADYTVYLSLMSFEDLDGDASAVSTVVDLVTETTTATTLTIAELENDRLYYIAMIASNDIGDSPLANEIVGTPTAPRDEATLSINDTGIQFSGVAETPFGNSASCDAAGSSPQDCNLGASSAGAANGGFRFQKLAANGDVLADDATAWRCVQDQTTGLIWEVKTIIGEQASDDQFNWFNQNGLTNGGQEGFANADGDICNGFDSLSSDSFCNTQAYASRINMAELCGVSNWRVPGLDELKNLVHYGKATPTIVEAFFPNTQDDRYWSASSNVLFPNSSWVVDFSTGLTSFLTHDSEAHLRLVSFGAAQ